MLKWAAVVSVALLIVPSLVSAEVITEEGPETPLSFLGDAAVWSLATGVPVPLYGETRSPNAWMLFVDAPPLENMTVTLPDGSSVTSDVLVRDSNTTRVLEVEFYNVNLSQQGAYTLSGPGYPPQHVPQGGGGRPLCLQCVGKLDRELDMQPHSTMAAPWRPFEPVEPVLLAAEGAEPPGEDDPEVYECKKREEDLKLYKSPKYMREATPVYGGEGQVYNASFKHGAKVYYEGEHVDSTSRAWGLGWAARGRSVASPTAYFTLAMTTRPTVSESWWCESGYYQYAQYVMDTPEFGIYREKYAWTTPTCEESTNCVYELEGDQDGIYSESTTHPYSGTYQTLQIGKLALQVLAAWLSVQYGASWWVPVAVSLVPEPSYRDFKEVREKKLDGQKRDAVYYRFKDEVEWSYAATFHEYFAHADTQCFTFYGRTKGMAEVWQDDGPGYHQPMRVKKFGDATHWMQVNGDVQVTMQGYAKPRQPVCQ